MPYVDLDTRVELQALHIPPTEGAGELTYVLQQALQTHIQTNGLRYTTLAECLGALEGAKADLVRRVLDPYERAKQAENGDVWDPGTTPALPTTRERHFLLPIQERHD